jgi:phosphoribosylanthranilate isomerase
MSLKIKICGLLEQENIVEVARLKPDLMGFIFYPGSVRNAAGKLTPEITISLPHDIRKTGVFVNADFEVINRCVKKYSLHIVQLHGDESVETCCRIRETGITVIKAFNLFENTCFKKYSEYIPFTDYFLFDTLTRKHGGSGHKFNWKILGNYDLGHPFFLSGGIGPPDVGKILEISNPELYGIDLNSRFEIKPGLKDTALLKKFIAEIRLNTNLS